MRAHSFSKTISLLFFISLASVCQTAAQQPPGCAQDFFCLFNQEAEASGPQEVYKYSRDLIGLILPAEVGKDYIDSLSERLAKAEITARSGRARLVPETDVVRGFNQLMRTIGAPPTITADTDSMRRFRARSATVPTLSALFTASRNGTNCDPGEAVLLGFLLLENDGKLSEHIFDSYAPSQASGGEKRFSVLVGERKSTRNAKQMLSDYSSQHRREATFNIFNRLAKTLGF